MLLDNYWSLFVFMVGEQINGTNADHKPNGLCKCVYIWQPNRWKYFIFKLKLVPSFGFGVRVRIGVRDKVRGYSRGLGLGLCLEIMIIVHIIHSSYNYGITMNYDRSVTYPTQMRICGLEKLKCFCRKVLADEGGADTESDDGQSLQTHSSSAFSAGWNSL